MRAFSGGLILGVAMVGALSTVPATTRGDDHLGTPSDFNGDGYADLAIGTPFEHIGTASLAGTVSVLYGSAAGLSAAGDQHWSQDSAAILGVSGAYDEFGFSVASGDFDRDGYADLAIGVPGDTGSDGGVNVLYGSASGLTAAGNQLWTRDSITGVPVQATLGRSLAAGDFDGDGYPDIAIGSPNADDGGTVAAGIVAVLRGSASGLTATGSEILTRAQAGVPYQPNRFYQFGASMAAGDLNGDGKADLAIGAENSMGGDVAVFYGSDAGPAGGASQVWTQDSPGIRGTVFADDEFGHALAVGDFDADGFGDLAIGVAGEGAICQPECLEGGAVNVIYGSATGLTASGNQLWSEASAGVPGRAEPWDQFGGSLASGDFDGDGHDDLAIGVPGEDPSPHSMPFGSGVVYALYGSGAGLSATGVQRWTQDSAGVPGTAEPGDWFGSSLVSANYGWSGRDDLAIGVPRETLGRVNHAGVVDVLYGGTSGLAGAHAQGWSKDTPGVLGTAAHEYFGLTLGK